MEYAKLYCTETYQNLPDELKKYNIIIEASQEVRWTRQMKVGDYIMHHEGINNTRQFGTELHKYYKFYMKESGV